MQDFDVAGVSDGAIDLDDYAGFECCLYGPGVVPPATDIGHDSEPDGDVDLADWAEFQTCFGSTAPGCLATFDFDAASHSDGIVNLGDLGGFTGRLSGPNIPASGGCPRRSGSDAAAPGLRAPDDDTAPGSRAALGLRAAPASGTFALHGRPIDVLSDGLVLMDFRARVYLPTLGRWLQRDPSGYTDGGNLYESFRGNPGRFTDSEGRQGLDLVVSTAALWTKVVDWYEQAVTGQTPVGDWEEELAGLAGTPRHRFVSVVGGLVDVETGSFHLTFALSTQDVDQMNAWAAAARGGASVVLGENLYLSRTTEESYRHWAEAGAVMTSFIPIVPVDYAFDRSLMELDKNFIMPPQLPPLQDWLYRNPGWHATIRVVPDIVFAAGWTATGHLRTARVGASGDVALVPSSRGAQLRACYGVRFEEYVRFRGQGFSPAQANYLPQPYRGIGHHLLPRRWGLPSPISENRFNIMKPKGISIGRFYERHYLADPKWLGTGFPRSVGGSWSGRSIGLERPGIAGRLWYGSPAPLKIAGGAAATAGAGGLWWWLSDDSD